MDNLLENHLIGDLNDICKTPPFCHVLLARDTSLFPHTLGEGILQGRDPLGITLQCPAHPLHTTGGGMEAKAGEVTYSESHRRFCGDSRSETWCVPGRNSLCSLFSLLDRFLHTPPMFSYPGRTGAFALTLNQVMRSVPQRPHPRWISRTPHVNKTAFCGVTCVSR